MQNIELKQVNDRALATTKKYTELFDCAPVAYFTLSQTGEILELNLMAAQMLGKERAQLQNCLLSTFVIEKSKNTFNHFFEQTFSDYKQETCEIFISSKENHLLHIQLTGIASELSEYCLVTALDLTEKKSALTELEESRNKISAILNAIPDLIFIQNNAGDYVDYQVAQADDLYTMPDQFIGKNMSEVLPDEIYQKFNAIFKKAIETQQVQSLEYSIPTLGGEQFFDVKVIAYDEDRVLSICRNITERHQVEAALKDSEEQLKEIFDNSADNIFMIDVMDSHTFILRRANKSMVNVLNKSKKEVENQLVENVFHNDNEVLYESHYQQCIDKRAVYRYEEITEIGNRLINYSTVLVPLFDASGKVFRLIGISRDITERKQREASMIHADRMTSLGEMASGMAHEINQPMNNISMVMENMLITLNRDVHIPEDYMRNKLSRVFENIERIRKIIDHVRVFSRKNIESEQIYFNVNESIAKSISMVIQQFYDNRIKLNIDLQGGLPEVDGNLYKFEQVILNLLSNGRDSLLEKRANAEISDFNIDDQYINIKSYFEGNQIRISVSDNGMGIDQSIINHIMLPFYTTKEVGKGTGLGLSISHQIINEMNGDIEITSELGKSTTFTIILNIEKRN
jgi:PAS domain S-box-containing protein